MGTPTLQSVHFSEADKDVNWGAERALAHLEIHLRRMPALLRKGTRRILACSVPVIRSRRWLHEVPAHGNCQCALL